MEIVKYGSLMHGWWVDGFKSTTLLRLPAHFSCTKRRILAWRSHENCSQLSPWNFAIGIMLFGLLELQICQKHCTYLKLGWKNVFPNSDQLVASEACLKRHLLTKWSSLKLEIWVLSFKWPSFSPRGGL